MKNNSKLQLKWIKAEELGPSFVLNISVEICSLQVILDVDI